MDDIYQDFPEQEEECRPLDFPIADQVEETLGEGGGIAQRIKDFRSRPEQIKMARGVARVFANPADSRDFVVEASTGIGKTLAYGIPALMSGRRVIISTATRYLQEQLFSRDLRLIADALGLDSDIVVLKGRASYVCLDRLAEAASADDEQTAQIAEIREWAAGSGHGDLDKYTEGGFDSSLRPQITSTSDNCKGRKCAKYKECFVYRARDEALKAKVVVTNHTLLLCDMQLRAQGATGLLPKVEVCIFDEAHRLLGTASDVYSSEISIPALSRQLTEMVDELKEDEDTDSIATKELANAASTSLMRMQQALVDHSRTASSFDNPDEVAAGAAKALAGEGLAMSADDVVRAGPHQDYDLDAAMAQEGVGEIVDRAIEDMNALADHLSNSGEGGEETARFGSGKIFQIVNQLCDIVTGAGREVIDVVSYYRVRGVDVELCMIPFDLSQIYSEQIRKLCRVGVYTSATLCARGKFDYFTGHLGLGGAETMICPSDFDYPEQSLLWLPAPDEQDSWALPNAPPRRRSDYQRQREQMMTEFIGRIIPVLRQVNGRSMILLTSKNALGQAARELRQADLGMTLLVQGEEPPAVLMNRFLEEQPAVLLGMATFWEGVDIRGSSLVFVAIDKLPFEYQETPVNIKRKQFMDSRKQSFFRDYLLPKAVLRLKQGAGRLIRDHNDYGIVAIGDERLVTKNYRNVFIESLPPFKSTKDGDEVLEFAIKHCGRRS